MRALATFAALAACTASSGCVTAAVGAAASVGLFAVQDRTIGEGIDDATASQRVKTRLMAADYQAFREVDVEVAEGALLLSGGVPTEEHRRAAETIARTVPNLRAVYVELEIGAPSTLAQSAQDEWITAQTRTRFFASPAVRGVNVNIETYHGTVYLMGLARTDLELRRAAEIASIVPGVRRVVSFMEVRAAPVPYYAAAITPPAPDFRIAQPDQATGNPGEMAGASPSFER